jgi:hypothetical protein
MKPANRISNEEGRRLLAKRAKGRQPSRGDGMNKLERDYAQHLELLLRAGEIAGWTFEDVKLRLAKRTWYTPDFFVVPSLSFRLEFHETKGFWRDDAKVKFKVAAEMFPTFRFLAVYRDGAGWRTEEV